MTKSDFIVAAREHIEELERYLAKSEREVETFRAENERLEALFQRQHGVHSSWVTECDRLKAELKRVTEERDALLYNAGRTKSELSIELAALREQLAAAQGELQSERDLREQNRAQLATSTQQRDADVKRLAALETAAREAYRLMTKAASIVSYTYTTEWQVGVIALERALGGTGDEVYVV